MWDTCDWKNMNFNKAGHAACELCISHKNVWRDTPLGLFKITAVTPAVVCWCTWGENLAHILYYLAMWLCSCNTILFSSLDLGAKEVPVVIFGKKNVIRGVNVILPLIYLFFIVVDLLLWFNLSPKLRLRATCSLPPGGMEKESEE